MVVSCWLAAGIYVGTFQTYGPQMFLAIISYSQRTIWKQHAWYLLVNRTMYARWRSSRTNDNAPSSRHRKIQGLRIVHLHISPYKITLFVFSFLLFYFSITTFCVFFLDELPDRYARECEGSGCRCREYAKNRDLQELYNNNAKPVADRFGLDNLGLRI